MSKYIIWNGTDTVYTYGPPYKFTAEEWAAKYPWTEVVPAVISGEGAINGAFCMPLADMLATHAKQGVAFEDGMTDQQKLDAIEAWEDAQEAAMREAAAAAAEQAAAEAQNAERQTAALEAIADGQTTENAAALEALLTGVDA